MCQGRRIFCRNGFIEILLLNKMKVDYDRVQGIFFM